MTGKTLVLGVGNPIMSDDAVGLHVVRRVQALLGDLDDVVVRESHRGGLDLVDLMAGFERVVIVDAFSIPHIEPGTILSKGLEDFETTNHLYGAHGVDLPTAIALGRLLGEDMPDEIEIVGLVVVDAHTLGEQLNPEIESAVEPAARAVIEIVRS